MSIKAFGRQGFLNPPGHEDSGWFKFSVRGTTKKNVYGKVNSRTIIADCSHQVELAFDIWGVSADSKDADSGITEALKDVKQRRAKAIKLRKAVDDYTQALLDAYDVAEQELKELQSERKTARDS